jgi:two-component system NarL family sensor kinase
MYLQINISQISKAIYIATGILFLLVLLLIFFVILYRKSHNIFLKEKELMQINFEQELLKTQLEIQEETLKHISEEIHDNIGQVLSLAKLHLNVLPVPPAKENETSVEKVKQLVGQAITDLRHLSKSLHPDRINELGLQESIKQELDMLEKSGLYETNLQIKGAVFNLSAAKQTIIFRIVQEGISNIIKHAAANRVDVHLVYEQSLFVLELKDNGTGFNQEELNEQTLGIGLRNIRNRSALIGATVHLSQAKPSGTILKIALPETEKETLSTRQQDELTDGIINM